MWLTIMHAEFAVPVRAIMAPDYRWYFLGSDVARLMGYKNTSQFNKTYSDICIGNVMPRCFGPHLSRRDLETKIVTLKSLEKNFDQIGVIQTLNRIFDREDYSTKPEKLSPDYVSMKRERARIVNVVENPDRDENASMMEYLHSYAWAIVDMFHGIEHGVVAPIKTILSEDAPRRIILKFADGKELAYVRET